MPKPVLAKEVADDNALYYLWAFPGTPLTIRLKLSLVPRLRALIPRNVQNTPVECGGFLLGTGGPTVVSIDDIYLLTFPRQSPHFLFTEAEKVLFREGICKHANQVVGYFRTDLREGVRLYEEDLSLISELFAHPSDVFLVIDASEAGTPMAGFFFWDSGFVFGASSFMPFPLDQAVIGVSRGVLGSAAELPTGSAQSGLQIVDSPSNAETEKRPTSNPQDGARSRSERVRRARHAVAGTFVVLVCCLLAAGVYQFGVIKPAAAVKPSDHSPVIPAVAQSSPISLSATRSDRRLVITWDSHSRAVADARIGVLSITDGGLIKEIPLTRAQLQVSKLVFEPRTDQIEVALELFSADGQKNRDSVIFLINRSASVAVSAVQRSPPAAAHDTTSPASGPIKPVTKEIPEVAVPPQQTRTAQPVVVDEPAPPLLQLTSSLPSLPPPPEGAAPELPSSQTSSIIPNAPTVVQTPDKVPASIPGRRVDVEPPEVIVKIKPNVPANLSSILRQRVEVDVRLYIDDNGKVRRVESSTPPGQMGTFLAKAASNAAKDWRFRPARIGGKNVPGEYLVHFAFGPATK